MNGLTGRPEAAVMRENYSNSEIVEHCFVLCARCVSNVNGKINVNGGRVLTEYIILPVESKAVMVPALSFFYIMYLFSLLTYNLSYIAILKCLHAQQLLRSIFLLASHKRTPRRINRLSASTMRRRCLWNNHCIESSNWLRLSFDM